MDEYYKRRLPHYFSSGYACFITFRLANSLPQSVILNLQQDREDELKKIALVVDKRIRYEKYHDAQAVYFGKFDSYLDKLQSGPTWLSKPDIADIIFSAIRIRHNKEFKLIACTVMPNHVHIVFIPFTKSEIIDDSGRSSLLHKSIKITEEIIGGDFDNVEGMAEQVYSMKENNSQYILAKILQNLKRYTAKGSNRLLNRTGPFWQHESYDHLARDENELKRIVIYVLNNPIKAGLCDAWKDWPWTYLNSDFFAL
jgi:REP element-mobilizing transposase RayT